MAQSQMAPAILVVEDEDVLRRFVMMVLENKGYVVHTASNGQEAAALFREQADNVALLVTDLTMPLKNGIELVKEVKAIKPELPVVVMSGNWPEWKEKLEGVTFISKPFKYRALLEQVEKYLGVPQIPVVEP